MRNLIFALFLFFPLSIISADNHNCISIIVENEAIFNLLPFATANSFNIIDPSDEDIVLSFSLCLPQAAGCKSSVYGTLANDETPDYCDDVAISAPSYQLLSVTSPEEGLSIIFPEHQGQTSEIYYQLKVNLLCDESATDINQTVFNMTTDFSDNEVASMEILVQGYSSLGCPVASVSRFNAFLDTYRIIFFLVFLLLGGFICFFGLKMFNITTFTIITLAGALTLASLFYNYVDLNTAYWVLWFIFIICVLLGAGLGILAVRYKKGGFFGLGFGLGIVIGLLFYKYVIGLIFENSPVVFMYILSAILGTIGGIIALKNWKAMTIFSTSVVGSYLSIRAISLYAGGFPGEIDLIKGNANLTAWSYLYLAGIIGMSILGSRYQFRRYKGLENEDILLEDTLAANSRYKEILLDGI